MSSYITRTKVQKWKDGRSHQKKKKKFPLRNSPEYFPRSVLPDLHQKPIPTATMVGEWQYKE